MKVMDLKDGVYEVNGPLRFFHFMNEMDCMDDMDEGLFSISRASAI